jgi:uncharacterized membrane protein (UPF0127 family)
LFLFPFGRRVLAAALALVAAGSVGAGAAGPAFAAGPTRVAATNCTEGQPLLKPLQPLALVTEKGRFAFKVEDADTYQRRETGLMCRTVLSADRGMLFDFRGPTDDVAFWMKNTLIPLDIVFIRPDGTVLSIARNARPLDETPLPAGGAIRGVLEIAGGRAAQIGLMPGDRVLHRIFPQ